MAGSFCRLKSAEPLNMIVMIQLRRLPDKRTKQRGSIEVGRCFVLRSRRRASFPEPGNDFCRREQIHNIALLFA
jgi:hypothetical protein